MRYLYCHTIQDPTQGCTWVLSPVLDIKVWNVFDYHIGDNFWGTGNNLNAGGRRMLLGWSGGIEVTLHTCMNFE